MGGKADTAPMCYAAANSTFSMSVESLLSARELFTRLETGHFCRRPLGAGLSNSTSASPVSQGSKSFSASRTGIRSCTSATSSFGSAIIMAQEVSGSPVSRFFHLSQMPAAVSAEDPSRAVKYQGCLPLGHVVRRPVNRQPIQGNDLRPRKFVGEATAHSSVRRAVIAIIARRMPAGQDGNGPLARFGHIADGRRHAWLAASAGVWMIVPRPIGVRLTNPTGALTGSAGHWSRSAIRRS